MILKESTSTADTTAGASTSATAESTVHDGPQESNRQSQVQVIKLFFKF